MSDVSFHEFLGPATDAGGNFGESVVDVRQERHRGQAARGGHQADGRKGALSGGWCCQSNPLSFKANCLGFHLAS